ncbi:MAG: transglycosylase SLT domain-containing protein [Gammaproteobacteria bacterium]
MNWSAFSVASVILTFTALALIANNADAAGLSKQRELYTQARHELAVGDLKDFEYLASQLKDYPLYPYLRYEELRRRMSSAPEKDIRAFLDNYSYIPAARRIRQAWLNELMKRGQHSKFQQYYEVGNKVAHNCFDLQARMKAGNTPEAIKEIKAFWLVGSSQPNQCDPLFAWLEKQGYMDDELIWQRIDLAMAKRDIKLAKYLAGKLSTKQVHWFALLNSVHRDPKKILTDPDLKQDHPLARKVIAYGARRWARKDVTAAAKAWQQLSSKYQFSEQQLVQTQADIALTASLRHHSLAADLMSQLPADIEDADVQQWRARAAMRANDWPAVLRSIVLMDVETKEELEWKYWRARALEEMGVHTDAKYIYQKIARERDYYGFLAADRVQQPYEMNDQPLQFTDFEIGRVLEYPPLIRARELLEAGQTSHAYNEWKYLTAGFDAKKLQIAAYIAHQWDWYHTAIFTVARGKHYDDLQLRFPQPYDDIVSKNARRFSLTPEYVYGVMRQESAMNSIAKSHAGARGLMQLMPATAKDVAKSLKIKSPNRTALLQPKVNVQLGSKYLRSMLDRYDNQQVLATASYNAGPHRVKRWLPPNEKMSADVWVDTIPYDETRKYVRRVMAYSTVYEWKMAHKTTRLQSRMPPVPAK